VDQRFDEVVGNQEVDARWISEAARLLVDGGAAYVFTCWDRLEDWKTEIQEQGLRVRSCIVWDKGIHGLADLQTCWAPQHELILFASKGRHVLKGARPKDVVRVNRVSSAQLQHPYQKPIELLSVICQASCLEGDTVLDPYMGSGSTGVACIKEGINFIGCEIDPKHFATARRRIRDSEFTLF
jgi:site-specific DNA-methyltransferase (adenine-specific)